MKSLLLVIPLFLSIEAFAGTAKKNVVLDVNFERNGKAHQYLITKGIGKKPDFLMIFVNEKKKTQTRKISQRQADLIKNDATRIIWENQYRKPSSSESCREYATVKTDAEKTRVCYENKALVGRTFGFLNSLNSIFK
jgi:hypothetical protein